MSVEEHRAAAPASSRIAVAILVVSDTRTIETDRGGSLAASLTEAAGFRVSARVLARDDGDAIRAGVRALVDGREARAVLVTGGTGFAARDVTVEAVAPLFERTIDGFGELFRMLSFQEVGAAAMLSRAAAGIVAGVPVFLMPGSPAAVKLALERLILPDLGHLVGHLGGP